VYLFLVAGACEARHTSEGGERARTGALNRPTESPTAAVDTLPPELVRAVVEVRATNEGHRSRCQGVALTGLSVATAKHCVTGALQVRLWNSEEWVSVRSSKAHSQLDLAVLTLSGTLPITRFPSTVPDCRAGRSAIALCYAGLGAPTTELKSTFLEFTCSARGCFSAELVLPPGASGCPLFDPVLGSLVGIGVASLKDSSRVVCLTNGALAELEQ
jgi:hypothetical protein